MLPSDVTKGYETISLQEMEQVKLMNRVDTKYVAHLSKIRELLEMARGQYLVQQIEGECNLPYYTRYFDTAEADMYYQHQRGKKTRQKIRKRVYEGSDTPPFLEIKSKNNKGRTKKKRVTMDVGEELDLYEEFLLPNTIYAGESLSPVIENHFYRITLVNPELTERITIDTGLEFHNLSTGESVSLPEIGIIEWKRDGLATNTRLKEFLRRLRIHPGSFSKYCIGMALTDGSLPRHRLKPKLRQIQKIIDAGEKR